MGNKLPWDSLWENGKGDLDGFYLESDGPETADHKSDISAETTPETRGVRLLEDIAGEAGITPKTMQMRLSRIGIHNNGKRGEYDDTQDLANFLRAQKKLDGVVRLRSTNRLCYNERYVIDLLSRSLGIESQVAEEQLQEIKDSEEASGKYRAEPTYIWLRKKGVDVLKTEKRGGYRLYELVVELGLARGEDIEYHAGFYHVKKALRTGDLKVVDGLYPKKETDNWVSKYWKNEQKGR